MRTFNVTSTFPALVKVLDAAMEENVILLTSDGRRFVVAEIDDFAEEIAKVRANKELMQLLDERSKETEGFTLSEVREQLGIKPKRRKS
jgi:hypothetical protein